MNKPIVSLFTGYTYPDRAYGVNGNTMPWLEDGGKGLPGDLPRFSKHTKDAPDGRVNLLVGGRLTVTSMGNVPLGEKRVMVGISNTLPQCGGYGPGRYFAKSINDALVLAEELNAYRIIFIGGEYFWLHGLDTANEVHITIAHRVCNNPNAKRLREPLHVLARESDMILHKHEIHTPGPERSWAEKYEFQTWIR